MTFQEWFNSEPYRAKYTSNHPAYLAAQEAWEAAHEACAKVCDELAELNRTSPTDSMWEQEECAAAIRARGETK